MRKKFLFTTVAILFVFISLGGYSQDMKSFTWDAYKTKFQVPTTFNVTESTGDYWSGTNNDITMSIYPRKGENLNKDKMKAAVLSWATSSGVTEIGDAIILDPQKLNGYNGVLYEGQVKGFPVGTLLIVDPDYPDISLYIWISYRAGLEDTVIKMLMSFTPN